MQGCALFEKSCAKTLIKKEQYIVLFFQSEEKAHLGESRMSFFDCEQE